MMKKGDTNKDRIKKGKTKEDNKNEGNTNKDMGERKAEQD